MGCLVLISLNSEKDPTDSKPLHNSLEIKARPPPASTLEIKVEL